MIAIIRLKNMLVPILFFFLTGCASVGGGVPESSSLARIQPGMSKGQVLLILGQPDPTLTIAFPRRHEFSYGWTFHDIGEPYNFHVLFDAEKETVRSAMIVPFRVIVDFH